MEGRQAEGDRVSCRALGIRTSRGGDDAKVPNIPEVKVSRLHPLKSGNSGVKWSDPRDQMLDQPRGTLSTVRTQSCMYRDRKRCHVHHLPCYICARCVALLLYSSAVHNLAERSCKHNRICLQMLIQTFHCCSLCNTTRKPTENVLKSARAMCIRYVRAVLLGSDSKSITLVSATNKFRIRWDCAVNTAVYRC